MFSQEEINLHRYIVQLYGSAQQTGHFGLRERKAYSTYMKVLIMIHIYRMYVRVQYIAIYEVNIIICTVVYNVTLESVS